MRSTPRFTSHPVAAVVVQRIAALLLVTYGLLAFLLMVTLAPQSDNKDFASGDLGFLMLMLSIGGTIAAGSAVALARRQPLAAGLSLVALNLLAFGTLLFFV